MANNFIRIFTALLVALVFLSCKPEEEKQSGVVGRITAAEGSSANAVVKIYKALPVEDDEYIWSVTAREEAVGFPYDVKFTYDHRTQIPELIDTADGDGNFRFPSVVGGEYIIVAEKLGQGFTVPKQFSTSGSDVDVGELRLPRVVVYEQAYVMRQNTTWESGSHYIIRDRTLRVDDDYTLTIEPGAIVLLAGGSSLEIDGTLVCKGTPDNFIRFMAADVLSRVPDVWQEVKIDDGASTPEFEYVSFRNGSTAINLEADSGYVRNCYFARFSAEAILAQAVGVPPMVSRCVFERIGTGIYNTSTSGFKCENSIFQSCDPYAIKLYYLNDAEVACNWFRDCGGDDSSGSGARGVIKLDLVTDTEIHHNHFETSFFGLQVGSRVDSTTYAHHNIFNRMYTVMYVGVTEDQRGPSNPKLAFNCFTVVDRYVINVTCNQHNTRDLEAMNNYWSTTSLNEIEQRYIHDQTDDGTCPSVMVTPILTSCNDVLTQTGTRAGLCQ